MLDISPRGVSVIPNLGNIISAAIGVIFVAAGLIMLVMLAWGGIAWMTAGDNKENVQKARDRITHALIGLAIIVSTWGITKTVEFFFGIDIFGNLQLPSALNSSSEGGGSSEETCSLSSSGRCQGKTYYSWCDEVGGVDHYCSPAEKLGAGGDGKWKCVCTER